MAARKTLSNKRHSWKKRNPRSSCPLAMSQCPLELTKLHVLNSQSSLMQTSVANAVICGGCFVYRENIWGLLYHVLSKNHSEKATYTLIIPLMDWILGVSAQKAVHPLQTTFKYSLVIFIINYTPLRGKKRLLNRKTFQRCKILFSISIHSLIFT